MNTPVINAIIGKTSNNSFQYKQVVLLGGGKFSDQISEPNTKYIVRYNFNLEGQTITMPDNCILAIDGGSLSNGEIIGNNTVFLNVNKATNILNNITLSGTWGQSSPFHGDTSNLSLVYFDTTTKKLLWWDGDQFIELL